MELVRVEEWRDMPEYEGLYQVSSFGRVKSLDRIVNRSNGRKLTVKERIRIGTNNGNGYYSVLLSKNGNKKRKHIHVLVAEAFLNHKPDGTLKIVVDHISNVKENNRLENLQLITQSENCSKDKKNGTSRYTGVLWCKNGKKWKAIIRVVGKQKHLGYFTNEEEAHQAYQRALKEYTEHNRLTRHLKRSTEIIDFNKMGVTE